MSGVALADSEVVLVIGAVVCIRQVVVAVIDGFGIGVVDLDVFLLGAHGADFRQKQLGGTVAGRTRTYREGPGEVWRTGGVDRVDPFGVRGDRSALGFWLGLSSVRNCSFPVFRVDFKLV